MDIVSGNFTFLFTDIEGSTKLAQEFPDSLPAALHRHHEIVGDILRSNDGFVFETIGDAFYSSFENAADAIKAAVEIQRALASEKWKDAVIKIRIGIHRGYAEWDGSEYTGYITLARAARVMSSSYGEQIIISNDVYESVKDKFHLINPEGKNSTAAEAISKDEIYLRDLGERRLKDLKQPLRLFQVVADGIRKDFPPLKTLDARPNNLPIQLTSFIGRVHEMEAIKNSLQNTRLLTLTGPGGTGKSRLALEIAADIIDDFEHGVWLVELASIMDPAHLPQVIIKTLGTCEKPVQAIEKTLLDFLGEKELLLILDNCEHIINACSKLSEKLLAYCPKLKIVATSREALRCSGELIHNTSALAVPIPGAKFTPEQLMQYESVQLFVERARSVNTNFKVSNENVQLIALICRNLDGIPLAIELAAARSKIFSVAEIYKRLNDRFNLLVSGLRTALPRQQTLRAMIDWSYDLLSENEKTMWARLTVFSGGWKLEAAENVCGENFSANEVINILSELAAKSIIVFSEDKSRFSMLETIREYGCEKLEQMAEHKIISDRHLKYYSELADSANNNLKSSKVFEWLNILDNESENLERALQWSAENLKTSDGMRLAANLANFWKIRGYITEGMRWIENFLQMNPDEISPEYCEMLSQMGSFLRMKSDLESAKHNFEKCLHLSTQINYKRGISESINGLGLIEYDKGRYEQAAKLYEQNLKSFYESNDRSGIAHTLNNLGTVALDLGDSDKAYNLYQESLMILREIGDVVGIARALNNLVVFEFENGRYVNAMELLQENLKFNRKIGNKLSLGITLNNSGNVAFYQGDFKKAFEYFNESLEIYRNLGDKYQTAYALINLGNLKLETNEPDSALKYFQESYEISTRLDTKLQIALSLFGMGRTAFFNKQFEKSLQYYIESITRFNQLGSRKDVISNIFRIAELKFINDKNDIAAKLLGFVKNYFDEDRNGLAAAEQNTFNELVSELKKKSDEKFEEYFNEGKIMSMNDAVKLAIDS